jgi:hypothetical protein
MLIGIDQHRQRPFRHGPRLGRAHRAARIAGQRLKEERALIRAHLVKRDGPDAGDARRTLMTDLKLQRRRAEPVADLTRQTAIAGLGRLGEGDEHLFGRRDALAQRIGQPGVEVRQGVGIEILARQLDHGLHRRADPVPPRLGQQRGVISCALIGVGSRQIEHIGPPLRKQSRAGQII